MTVVREATVLREDKTTEELVIEIDPILGSAPAYPLYTQAEFDSFGPLDTIGSALRIVPTQLYHKITLSLEDENQFPVRTVHALTQADIAELRRFVFHNFDLLGGYAGGAGMILITSARAITYPASPLVWIYENGSPTYIKVLSDTAETIEHNVTYSANPPDNTLKRYFATQGGGVGEDQIVPVRSHVGKDWVAGTLSPVPAVDELFQLY